MQDGGVCMSNLPKDSSMKTKEFLIGGDISALARMEQLGAVYYDNGTADDPIRILIRYGANCFRLRLFVEPESKDLVVNDLSYTIDLAKRIKAYGAKLVLDFFYSDTWADPSKQFKPKSWQNLKFAALVQRVYDYTRDCLEAMNQMGVLPEFVQPGNEIINGFLWDDGRLDGTEIQWRKFVKLLSSAVQAIRDVSSSIGIIIHIDRSCEWQSTRWFFENLEQRNVDYDIIGLSYYPFWHGPIDALSGTLNLTAKHFRKPIFIVETGTPYRPTWLPGPIEWEASPQGQKDFLTKLIRTVKSTPYGLGVGVLWWFPEAVPVKKIDIWCDGAMGLFDEKGNPLPALEVFRDSTG